MDAGNCEVASTNWSHWHRIPWPVAHQVAGRLQACIANAAKAGDWRKAGRLQKLVTHSIRAKALAVRRIIENRGRNTPGHRPADLEYSGREVAGGAVLATQGLQATAVETVLHPESER